MFQGVCVSGHLRETGFLYFHSGGTLWVVFQRQWEDTLLCSVLKLQKASREAPKQPCSGQSQCVSGPPVSMCDLTSVCPIPSCPHAQSFPFCVQSQSALSCVTLYRLFDLSFSLWATEWWPWCHIHKGNCMCSVQGCGVSAQCTAAIISQWQKMVSERCEGECDIPESVMSWREGHKRAMSTPPNPLPDYTYISYYPTT